MASENEKLSMMLYQCSSTVNMSSSPHDSESFWEHNRTVYRAMSLNEKEVGLTRKGYLRLPLQPCARAANSRKEHLLREVRRCSMTSQEDDRPSVSKCPATIPTCTATRIHVRSTARGAGASRRYFTGTSYFFILMHLIGRLCTTIGPDCTLSFAFHQSQLSMLSVQRCSIRHR